MKFYINQNDALIVVTIVANKEYEIAYNKTVGLLYAAEYIVDNSNRQISDIKEWFPDISKRFHNSILNNGNENCIDCKDCVACNGCISCTGCIMCTDCVNCTGYINCYNRGV